MQAPRGGSHIDEQWTLALDRQLCFALYAASRAVTALYRPLLDALGLTYPQYLVMLVLWEQESVLVKELGAALQLDYGTLTPLLKRLETHGLLRRERRADDERAVLITLTEQGTAPRGRGRTGPGLIAHGTGLETASVSPFRAAPRSLNANGSPAPHRH